MYKYGMLNWYRRAVMEGKIAKTKGMLLGERLEQGEQLL